MNLPHLAIYLPIHQTALSVFFLLIYALLYAPLRAKAALDAHLPQQPKVIYPPLQEKSGHTHGHSQHPQRGFPLSPWMQLFHSSASMDVPYKPNSKEYELDKNYGMRPQLQRRT